MKRAHPTRTPRAPRARPAAPGALASPVLDTPVRGRATRGVCPSASGWFRLAHVFEIRPHCRVCPTVISSHGRIAPIRLWTGPWVLRLRAAVNGAAADRAGRCLRPSGRAPEGGPCVPRWLCAQPLEETPGRCPHRSQPFPAPPPAVRGAPASSLTRLVSRPLVLVGVRLAHGFRHPTPLTSGRDSRQRKRCASTSVIQTRQSGGGKPGARAIEDAPRDLAEDPKDRGLSR